MTKTNVNKRYIEDEFSNHVKHEYEEDGDSLTATGVITLKGVRYVAEDASTDDDDDNQGILDLIANLSRRMSEVEERGEMLTEDVVMLDERTSSDNAATLTSDGITEYIRRCYD